MKTILYYGVLCCFATFAACNKAFCSVPVYKDTTVHPNEHRISHTQFLNRYGFNDTARALIDYYFEKRRKAKFTTAIAALSGGGAGVGFNSIGMQKPADNNFQPNGGNNTGGLFTGFLLFSVILGAGVIAMLGVLGWTKFSRRRLLKQLKAYKTFRQLPAGTMPTHAFRKHLRS